MEFRGIELHNIRELIFNPESGGYKMRRMPTRIAEYMSANTFACSGAELRFVPIDDEVRIKIRKVGGGVSNLAVFYGSVQSGWQNLYKPVGDEACEIVIPKSKNLETLEKITADNGFAFSPAVVRLITQSSEYEIFDVVGRCRPPYPSELPEKTYLAYGSSITHGSLAMHNADTYAVRLSEYFGCDYLNLGFAGNACLEAEVADYIAEECEFDFATLEMGINLFNKIDVDEFRRRVEYFVSKIAKSHPNKKIFCIDMFYMSRDIYDIDNPESKHNLFRGVVKDTVAKLALPNTVYVEGLKIMNGSRWLSEDLTHPNARGVAELSGNLAKFIENYI